MELVFIHLKVSNVDPITSFCFVKDLAYLGYFHSNVICSERCIIYIYLGDLIPWLVFDILLSWYQYQPYLSRTGIGSFECPPVIFRFYWLLRIWDILRILRIFFDVLFINSKKRVKHTHKNIKIWRVLWIHAMFSFSFIYTEGILRKEKSSRFSSQMHGKKGFLSLKLIQLVRNCV